MKKYLIIVFTFLGHLNFSQSYIPTQSVDSIVNKEVKKEFKKKSYKFLKQKFSDREIFIFKIYWMTYRNDSLNNDYMLTKKMLQNNTKFYGAHNNRKKFKYSCHGLIYKTGNDLLAAFTENGEIIYNPNNRRKFLFETIISFEIKYAFQLNNIKEGVPVFLVDKAGRIYVFTEIKDNNCNVISYKVIPLKDFKPHCCFNP